jgi:hypothetical protein
MIKIKKKRMKKKNQKLEELSDYKMQKNKCKNQIIKNKLMD